MWGISEQQARLHVRSLVNQVKAEMNIKGGVCYANRQTLDNSVAEHLGIQVRHETLPRNKFGIYVPNSLPKPSILLDTSKQSLEKLNFTYFHEITHHLIKQNDELYSWLNEASDYAVLLERLCDVGASEFLLPLYIVQESVRNTGFSIKLLPYIDSLYIISKPSILIQLLECAKHKCYGVICVQNAVSNKTVVEFATSSPPVQRFFISKGGTINGSHVIMDSFRLQNTVSGRDYIPFQNGNQNWKENCEAIFYKGKVYAIFNQEDPEQHNPYQLELSIT